MLGGKKYLQEFSEKCNPHPLPQCMPLSDYLDFHLSKSKSLSKWMRSGKSGIKWEQECRVAGSPTAQGEKDEIWPASQPCSELPLPQTKQWKMFAGLPFTHCLPFLLPRLAISTLTSSHLLKSPLEFFSHHLGISKANSPAPWEIIFLWPSLPLCSEFKKGCTGAGLLSTSQPILFSSKLLFKKIDTPSPLPQALTMVTLEGLVPTFLLIYSQTSEMIHSIYASFKKLFPPSYVWLQSLLKSTKLCWKNCSFLMQLFVTVVFFYQILFVFWRPLGKEVCNLVIRDHSLWPY